MLTTCRLPICTPPSKRRRLSWTRPFCSWILDAHLGDVQAALAPVSGNDLLLDHGQDFVEQAGWDDQPLGLRKGHVKIIVAHHGNGMQRTGNLHDLDFLRDMLAVFMLHSHN